MASVYGHSPCYNTVHSPHPASPLSPRSLRVPPPYVGTHAAPSGQESHNNNNALVTGSKYIPSGRTRAPGRTRVYSADDKSGPPASNGTSKQKKNKKKKSARGDLKWRLHHPLCIYLGVFRDELAKSPLFSLSFFPNLFFLSR